jgi:hypothetical protein
LSAARRLPWQNVLEVSYVGTFGRHLLNRRQFNVIPPGTLSKGTIGNADLTNPLHRAGVATNGDLITSLRPYPALSNIRWWEYTATSNYHSLQATLSRQTGRRFQYFLTYTFSKVLGTMMPNGEYDDIDPFDPRHRTYGTLAYDRTHVANASFNYQLPDLSKGGVLGTIVNGWQFSGISTFASGVPFSIGFGGDIASMGIPWYGTPDHLPYRIQGNTGPASTVMPNFTCNPSAGGTSVGEKIVNINCVSIPTFPDTGTLITPYYLRFPARMNHDITLFKNFRIGGEGSSKKLQFRVGAFNIFNQAVPSVTFGQDVDLALQTTCNVRVNGVPNGSGGTVDNICDPTGGFSLTENSKQNFGKIILQRGHRVVEFALKLYF